MSSASSPRPSQPPPAPAAAVPGTTISIELIERARGGEAAATDELYRPCLPRVRGLVAVRMGRMLVDIVDRDDLVQQTLLVALRGLQGFVPSSEGAFIAWLAAIVASRLSDAYRASTAEQRGGGRVQRRADLGMTTLSAAAIAARDPSPSQVAAAGEIDGRLEAALLALGSPSRDIVYCRLVLDMSYAEIAAQLQLRNADSVRATFAKAVARLRQRLHGGTGDD